MVTQLMTDPRGDHVMNLFDQYGRELHLVASILTDDAQLAERVVIQAITAHRSGPCTLRELTAAVYIAWLSWGPHPPTVGSLPPAGWSAAEAQLFELHALPDDQRAVVALCRFGGHTYRQAADVVALAADHVAGLLRTALRQLAAPRSIAPSQTA